MKRTLFLILASILCSAIYAEDYYLSSVSGSDTNAGTSANSPWKTLSKMNSIQLGPGDRVLFKSNETFRGEFIVNGSGAEGNPIIITSYGTGSKPIVTGQVGEAGGGDYMQAILVENNDNIVFDGLEIQNNRTVDRYDVDSKKAFGIHIRNFTDNTSLKNFVFRNMTFKSVYAVEPILYKPDFDKLEVSAIRVYNIQNTLDKVRNIQNVLVEDSYFTDIQRLGVHFKHDGANAIGNGTDKMNRIQDVVVRNCTFDHLGGSSVLPQRTYNCLIEHNMFDHPGASTDPRMPGRGSAVWNWHSINTVVQYNSCISSRGYLDSHGAHVDNENDYTFIQYNYMIDCEGGFVEILGGSNNSVYRFNVSVNDGWREDGGVTGAWWNSNHTIWISPDIMNKKPVRCEVNYIYNNTMVLDRNFETCIEIDAKDTHIFNNIFYTINGGGIGTKHTVIKTNDAPFVVDNNLYFGNIDSRFTDYDNNQVNADPSFTNTGSGADKYKLNSNSPALYSGITNPGPAIPGAGTGIFADLPPYPTQDYYGNPVDYASGNISIGAYNGVGDSGGEPVSGITVTPSQVTINDGQTVDLDETVAPENASNKRVSWTSSNESVATVDEYGVVTAIACGIANITATTLDGGFTATSQVTVNIPVSSVSLVSSTLDLTVNDSYQLTATVLPANACTKEVSWTSSNTNVATISNSGRVMAIGTGTASITVNTMDGNFSSTVDVTVRSEPIETNLLLNPGFESGSVSWTFNGSSSVITNNQRSGSNAGYIDGSGGIFQIINLNANTTYVLSAYGKVGQVGQSFYLGLTNESTGNFIENRLYTTTSYQSHSITFTTGSDNLQYRIWSWNDDGGSYYVDDFKLIEENDDIPVTGVTLNTNAASIDSDGEVTLSAYILPSNASNKAVTWSSSNLAVATVNNGVVTAVSKGTVLITTTTLDGNYTATAEINVLTEATVAEWEPKAYPQGAQVMYNGVLYEVVWSSGVKTGNCVPSSCSGWKEVSTNNTSSSRTITDKTNSNISVYPNPSTGTINVNLNGMEGVNEVMIFGLQGQVVFKQQIIADKITINTGNLKGLFVLTLQGPSQFYSERIIIE
ncbi:T9SS type A sorting domain-containing protein [Flammeovirga sp. MY04]|uniref:Ig-like domain-containing protein n=1 Tax=Flammeovirga sp. MY04 TaxID=1191459 RepID=UPI0008062C06|nr:Ig-like domain-containing protein [Flammeovirga sp. MY04]ANQ51740.1 T9SS type A sorting domain-containing protein [Flammeovirga sp. MY04]